MIAKCGNVDGLQQGADALFRKCHDYAVTMMLYIVYPVLCSGGHHVVIVSALQIYI